MTEFSLGYTRGAEKTRIRGRLQYTLNQWDYLIGYLNDDRLQISNALAENAIRPFAVGRRN